MLFSWFENVTINRHHQTDARLQQQQQLLHRFVWVRPTTGGHTGLLLSGGSGEGSRVVGFGTRSAHGFYSVVIVVVHLFIPSWLADQQADILINTPRNRTGQAVHDVGCSA